MGTSCLIPLQGLPKEEWMDDVYRDFARQDVINPPLDYHYDDIRRLDFGGSTI